MNRWLTFSLAACLASPLGSVSFAQDDPPAAEAPAAETPSDKPAETNPPEKTDGQKELAALIVQQNAVADEYNAILQGIKKQEDVAAIEKELAEIKTALAKAEAGDPDLAEAPRGAARGDQGPPGTDRTEDRRASRRGQGTVATEEAQGRTSDLAVGSSPRAVSTR